mgnify:FL=1
MLYKDRVIANYLMASFELNVLECFDRFNCVNFEEDPLGYSLICDDFKFQLSDWGFDA